MPEAPAADQTSKQALLLAGAVEYPVLRKLGKQNLRKFIYDRASYVREVAERKKQAGIVTGTPVSLSFSIDASLLASLVDLRQLGADIDTVEKVTDDSVQSWLDANCDIRKDGLSAAQVLTLVSKKLHINMSEKDPEQRIVMLFTDYSSLLRMHGLSWIIKEHPKVAAGHIVDVLRPKALQARVRGDLEFTHIHLKKDFLQFMKHVSQRAEKYGDYEDEDDNSSARGSNCPKQPGRERTARSSGVTTTPQNSGKTTVPKSADGSPKQLPDCLNPACKEKHFLKNCKSTSQERKDQLYAERAQARKASGEQRTTRADNTSSNQGEESVRPPPTRSHVGAKSLRAAAVVPEGRLDISFGTDQKYIALPDLGADDNTIPRSLLKDLDAAGAFVSLRTLEKPMSIELAVKGPGTSVVVRQQAQLTTTLHLSAGPLRLRNVRWLVSENDMDEVLIGRPLLKTLGLDAPTHLETVRDNYHDMDCSKIASPSDVSKLSRLLIRRQAGVVEADMTSGVIPGPVLPVSIAPPGDIADVGEDPTASVTEPTKLAAVRVTDSVTHGDTDQDPVEVPQLLDLPSKDSEADTEAAVRNMLSKAEANGISPAGLEELSLLVHEYSEVWRIALTAGPPALLPPLVVKLRADAAPVRVKLRRYPQPQQDFLLKFVDELVRNGMAYRNPNASWCSAPLLVPKPGPSQFRFTVDLRPVNKQTVPQAWPMPHIESELSKVRGATCFATFDLSNGYWQLKLDESSQECQSFITPEGIYTPTRVLHGTRNAVSHMQACVQGILEPLSKSLLAWLDDLLLHATDEKALLAILRMFLKICRDANIKLHPGKCDLFARTVRWCGRLITGSGVKFDPRRVQGLRDMSPPKVGADLQQFICALNWMRTSLPAFTTMISPLHILMEKVYAKAGGKRTKTAVAKIPLEDAGWTEEHTTCFQTCQSALENAVTLAHPSPEKRVCLYTDASNDFWSSITTQVPSEDLDLPHADQRHEPLAFLSGSFVATMKRWSIIEKEAYAVLASCERLDWLLLRSEGFSLFTDHNNLIYVFNPHGMNSALATHTAAKLIRWALKLSSYAYTIEHVTGLDNIWSDLLTRWAAPTLRARMSALVVVPTASSSDEEFVWPDAAELQRVQYAYLLAAETDDSANGLDSTERTNLSQGDDGLYRTTDGKVWIPADASDLQLRICIVAHTGIGGHRGYRTTRDAIRRVFAWSTLDRDVETFCNTCLNCQSTLAGNKTPRPFGQALHATRPNEVLHMDFLFMGPSTRGYNYLLILKDDLSGYLWLVPAKAADAETTIESLTSWFTTFGVVTTWVSDQGSHFKNKLVDGVRRVLRTRHHFTTAYSPWANGTVERACREVLRAVRALLSEFKLRPADWPDVIKIVQSALNNSPSPQRGNIAPITAFTGREPDSPLFTLVATPGAEPLTISDAKLLQLANIQTLRTAVDEIHKAAGDAASQRRIQTADLRAQKRGVAAANFSVGDYVLVSKRDFQAGEKLSLRWRGPRRVVSTLSDHVFDVEDLHTGAVTPEHASRLRFYADSALDVNAELLTHIAHNNRGYDVRALCGLRFDRASQSYQALVSWLGFDEEDNTWEPLAVLQEDVPSLVSHFLAHHDDSALATSARESLRT